MTTIDLGNITTKEQAEKIKAVLNGKTYMNFRVEISRVAYGYPVLVSTDYEADEKEIMGFIIWHLAESI